MSSEGAVLIEPGVVTLALNCNCREVEAEAEAEAVAVQSLANLLYKGQPELHRGEKKKKDTIVP